jgi:hypothetical protein
MCIYTYNIKSEQEIIEKGAGMLSEGGLVTSPPLSPSLKRSLI